MTANSFELNTALYSPSQIIDNGLGDDQAIENKLNPGVDRCWGGGGDVEGAADKVQYGLVVFPLWAQIILLA